MPKILLASPSWTEMYGGYQDAAKRSILYPPYGLTVLASIAKKAGWQPDIFDGELFADSIDAFKAKIRSFSPDIIGITSCTPTFHRTVQMANIAKSEFNLPVLLGGAHATVLYEEILQNHSCFDLTFVGEADLSFAQFLSGNITDKSRWDGIPGLFYKNESGKTVFTGPPRLLENLDEIPIGSRDLLAQDAYRWSLPGTEGRRFTTMNTSRGCPFDCVFCATHTLFGHHIRAQSPERVVNEIIHIYRVEGYSVIGFMDDNFTLGRERILSICEKVIEAKLDIVMDCWTSAASLTPEITQAMRKAGFVRVNIGVESGDPQILKSIKKGVNLEVISRAITSAKQAGLETCGYAILGLPGETRLSAKRTIQFLRKQKDLDYAFLTVAAPLPGSVMYDMAKKGEGGLKLLSDDFSHYKRYAEPVIEVNDLSAKDLANLQRIGHLKIYLMPHRAWRLLRRASIKETWENIIAFAKSVIISY